ncbi:hypothetical protein COY16_05710 [Candidatus Roizmanbacteria bacterium CG_4_10_14_0_2_um_filter_39_13]|uniref:Peptidase S8/S53 domain-containing protein n=1 Tax=Candidatus Roizmanbacteria bacterium CG_4_10_14_0_2_um_filter_39_13 TaxID=1974825 RepID=A0A2M7TVU6_9BACT|nr:MAG: hypothetical protein COY16_05710 [Candidatus Roizmanbacteria bacterium CG_4_10_14_0_2_um_filter_39_13]
MDGLLYEVDRSLYYLRIDTPDKKPVFINKNTNTVAEIPLIGYGDEEENARSAARVHDKIRLSTTIKSEDTSELRFEGAYSGDKGANSMRELFKLANAYPEKLFIAAAGNYGDDIREFRSELSAEWPNNILLCGQWNSQKNAPEIMTGNVHGADIYVDSQEQGFKQEGSSFSTAAISAYASILAQKGYDIPTIKATLLESCESIPYYVPPTIPNDQLTQEIFDKSFNQIVRGEAPVFKLEAFRDSY